MAKFMKKIRSTQFVEKEGVNAVATIVNRMGWTWRPTPNDDYGIDGEIEINREGTPTGKIIKVQCKSGKSYRKNESAVKFDFYANSDDVEYWMNCNVPVILVVHDPRKNKTYWVNVQNYLAKHSSCMEKPHKITFYKKRDAFSVNSVFDLCRDLLDETKIVEVMKNRIVEKIFSNLLPVSQMPLTIYGAPTEYTHASAKEGLIDSEWKPIYTIQEKRLWTFYDLYDVNNPLRRICISDNVQMVKAQEWLLDENRRRWYVNLLNQALSKRCRNLVLC